MFLPLTYVESRPSPAQSSTLPDNGNSAVILPASLDPKLGESYRTAIVELYNGKCRFALATLDRIIPSRESGSREHLSALSLKCVALVDRGCFICPDDAKRVLDNA